ncbi:hypothetical protein [Planctomicrobium sp. SH664]|uniref:hypothetical protein n=1 Tax=Planctomicrobium sp. SH664 TaxID=3448125 RepID=UPI003F5B33F8
MGLSSQVELELKSLRAAGTAMPTSLQVSEPSGLSLRIELTAVDTLSCAFSELALFVPQLQNSPFDALKKWAEALSRKITYLLENIGPLEFDPAAGHVLIRSTPPQQQSSGTQYYEMMLSSSGSGHFVMKRYQSTTGHPGRQAVDIQVTQEVLLRLIDDLLATAPTVP